MKIEDLLFMFAGVYSQVIPKGQEPNDITLDRFERIVNISDSKKELSIRIDLPLGKPYILVFKSEGLNWATRRDIN